MSVRKVLPPMLEAATALRDLAIEQTGDDVFIEPVQEQTVGRYHTTKQKKYGNSYESQMIVEWEDARTVFGDIILSHEDVGPLRAYAKYCDDIPQGSIVTIPTALDNGFQNEVFKIVHVKVQIKGTAFRKEVQLSQYKGDRR